MAKIKYYYDPETLSFKQINNRKRRLKYILFFLLSSLLFALIIILILYNINFMQTPKELSVRRALKENETQFAILNKKMQQMQEVLDRIAERDNTLYRTYFEMAPIPDSQRKSGFGGVNRYEELEKYIRFYQKIGMPTTLKEMHLENASYEDLLKVGQQATIEGETIHQMPFEISASDIAGAILAVDQYVRDLDK